MDDSFGIPIDGGFFSQSDELNLFEQFGSTSTLNQQELKLETALVNETMYSDSIVTFIDILGFRDTVLQTEDSQIDHIIILASDYNYIKSVTPSFSLDATSVAKELPFKGRESRSP